MTLFSKIVNHVQTHKKRVFVCSLSLIAIFILAGCKKLVEVSPPPSIITSNIVYESDNTASSVLTGIYTNLSADYLSNPSLNISLAGGLSADELFLFGGSANGNGNFSQLFLNRLSSGQGAVPVTTIWSIAYSKIYIINLAIEKLTASVSLTPSVKQQLTGEAKFLRAFFYFYLVNLYGDVPLALSSDYRVNTVLPRTAGTKVWQQIISDLKDAQGLLSETYVAADAKAPTGERVRPNKWAATALLARVLLYTSQWADAELQAGSVISHAAMYDTVALNNVFLKNGKEAIWQLQPVNAGWNTEEARVFVLPASGPTSTSNYPVYLSNQLLNAFEINDNRKTCWVSSVTVGSGAASATYYYPYKYKSATLNAPVTEYSTVLRLGEQYLIRAEARAQLNKTSEALSDLNVIRRRAGLPDLVITDQAALLNAIYHERQVELFTEWGHRWLDLKRTGKVDEVMSAVAPAKGTSWSSNWALYPIPLYDITQNPNLTQNPGY